MNAAKSLKAFGQSGLLQGFIGGVAGFRPIVDSEVSRRNRAEPDLVVTTTVLDEGATGRLQQSLQLAQEPGHA
jgi:hypothetical protein